jgi:ATP-dependent helicase/nuclease subunit A
VNQFIARHARWRRLLRQASLSNCLDAILAETHYADWLLAQERGAQKHANVQRLLGLAEQFDQFQRQGLFRFLRFVEAQQEAGAEPEVAAATAADAVRLMSVHQSKGLEFPVVVVADLGKGFNRQDLGAEIILDEEFGLAPQVRRPQTGVRYPSLPHWLARRRQERELLGEELRLLYVAMTRARDKLILTGSMSRKKWDSLPETWPEITPRALLAAKSCAEWLRLWLAHAEEAVTRLFHLRVLDDAALLEDESSPTDVEDAESGPALDDATVERLRTTLTWQYPFAPATGRAAKTSVTALRRQAAEELEGEAEKLFVPPRAASARRRAGKLSAADIGTAHHKFLQHVALAQAGSAEELRSEAKRLEQERLLTADEAGALDLAALAEFWQSEAGRKIRDQAARVKRELPFTARFAPSELDEIIRGGRRKSDDEFVVVQGVADLVVLLPDEIWLLDFKTDDVKASEVDTKKKFYAPQLQLYALALERIYGKRVTKSWLHFLTCGCTERVAPISSTTSPELQRQAG